MMAKFKAFKEDFEENRDTIAMICFLSSVGLSVATLFAAAGVRFADGAAFNAMYNIQLALLRELKVPALNSIKIVIVPPDGVLQFVPQLLVRASIAPIGPADFVPLDSVQSINPADINAIMDYMRSKELYVLDLYEAGLVKQLIVLDLVAAFAMLPAIGSIIMQLNAMKNCYSRPETVHDLYGENGNESPKWNRRVGLALTGISLALSAIPLATVSFFLAILHSIEVGTLVSFEYMLNMAKNTCYIGINELTSMKLAFVNDSVGEKILLATINGQEIPMLGVDPNVIANIAQYMDKQGIAEFDLIKFQQTQTAINIAVVSITVISTLLIIGLAFARAKVVECMEENEAQYLRTPTTPLLSNK